MEEVLGWVERAARGDERAYRELYRTHAPAVRRLLASFATLEPGEVDDVLQETFVRAFRALPGLQQPAAFRGWLMTIARNRAATRTQSAALRKARDEQLVQELDGAAAPLFPEALRLELDEAVVRQLIAELPPGPERETVELFYVRGEGSAREIAERLGVGKSTVTMRLERFRAKVKRELLRRVLARRME